MLDHARLAVGADGLTWVAATCAAYLVGSWAQRLLGGAPVANPVLIAIVLVDAMLWATGTGYRAYFEDVKPVHLLLGPATVALGVPLARNLAHVRRSLPALAPALILGAVTSIVVGYVMVGGLGGERTLALSMAPKAVTTPIAMAIADQIGGMPSLAAVLAISGGIVAATLGEPLLGWLGVTDPRAIGFASGLAGSGIAAAQVARRDPLAGAFAALAIGFNGITTSVIVPVIVRLVG